MHTYRCKQNIKAMVEPIDVRDFPSQLEKKTMNARNAIKKRSGDDSVLKSGGAHVLVHVRAAYTKKVGMHQINDPLNQKVLKDV